MRHAPFLAVALAGLTLAAACTSPDRFGAGARRATLAATGGDLLVRRPAQQLALSLLDLPPGFTIAEELKPTLDGAASPDPWGRLSAYGVTYAPAPGATGVAENWGDVVSSVNAYVGTAQAAEAFASWRSAVPAQYRLSEDARAQLGDETVVYVRAGEPGPRGVRPTCLVGLRARNVIASISVSAPTGAAAPVESALRLARLTAQRIQAVAGR